MTPKLSIVLPSIRTHNLDSFYDSIQLDFPWELIIVSPYNNTPYLKEKSNVKYVNDYGSPVRASCLGSSFAEGKYLTYFADDALVISENLKKVIEMMDTNDNEKTIISAKYYEGSDVVQNNDYYKIVNAYLRTPYIQDDWWILNVAVFHNSYFKYLGGWDSEFEVTCISHTDLALRAYRDNADIQFSELHLLDCEHSPEGHAPIEEAQCRCDAPLLKEIYSDPDCLNRTRIDFNNWENSPLIWTRRFG